VSTLFAWPYSDLEPSPAFVADDGEPGRLGFHEIAVADAGPVTYPGLEVGPNARLGAPAAG
jgi:hypothetical protein